MQVSSLLHVTLSADLIALSKRRQANSSWNKHCLRKHKGLPFHLEI